MTEEDVDPIKDKVKAYLAVRKIPQGVHLDNSHKVVGVQITKSNSHQVVGVLAIKLSTQVRNRKIPIQPSPTL